MNNLKMYLRTQARNCFLHIMGIFKVPQQEFIFLMDTV